MESGGLFGLAGKVALVTGGSRGLGLEMAEGLAEAGASLMLLARRPQWLEPAVAAMRARGFECEAQICDAASADGVEDAVRATLARFGRIDILVNNAGVSWGAPAEEMPLEKWRKVIDVNLTGAFLFARATGRHMIEHGQGGAILNIASVAGLRGSLPGALDYAGYVASKGGLIALTRELAAKWGRHGIRVNAIAPGFFPTRLTEKVLGRLQPDLEPRIPLGRIGRTGELKGVAVFLASPAAAYITGQTIAVDGGLTAV
jgi:NAD(P)-dependent dehydrogenase (short-subunit alcohol dehydrogenase family)